ncbi:RimK-like protein [Rhodopseudomonas sp. WA056]|uniref:RimK-like protein n=1 Tax=Rhodopseudomonas sp. WA056 TaxID=2269367 RepID=UPI0013DF0A0B|nr:RimK-like protein [Rhodopseudomonas sp. WA056]
MSTQILILSSIYDFAVDFVVRQLRARGVRYIRLNREQFQDLRLSFDPVAPAMKVTGLGIDAIVECDLNAVWFRSPVFLRNTPGEALGLAQQLARSQWAAFLRSMMIFGDARWMNHPAAVYKAECKPLQLQVADRCGFSVPSTVVGNSVSEIQLRFPDDVVIKSIDTVYLRDGADALFAYTNVLSISDLTDENLSAAPVIAQKFVSPKKDVRVTVVGDRFFAYEILVDGKAALGDWRLHKRDQLQYRQIELEPAVGRRCVDLCSRLNLPFGGIDLINSEGRFVFVEINPTGEWAWLPGADASVSEAIADWLCRGAYRDQESCGSSFS